MLAFWLTLLVSTLQSEYLYESFWGNEGRYSGLFLLTLYVAAYFVISRFWKFWGWVLEAMPGGMADWEDTWYLTIAGGRTGDISGENP